MEDNKTKKHDAIHKNLFQTLFPYAIQAMYPSLHENLDYTNMHFLKEEFQLPTSSSYFHIDRRYIDILAEVPLKNPSTSKDQKRKQIIFPQLNPPHPTQINQHSKKSSSQKTSKKETFDLNVS